MGLDLKFGLSRISVYSGFGIDRYHCKIFFNEFTQNQWISRYHTASYMTLWGLSDFTDFDDIGQWFNVYL